MTDDFPRPASFGTRDPRLADFVRESNLIEGIDRDPTAEELIAHERFLALERPTIDDLACVVGVLAPGHRLRASEGDDVIVGGYTPPPGGKALARRARLLVECIVDFPGRISPYRAHMEYESLHPFTDGNGRSGRLLWAWHMAATPTGADPFALRFLHRWYYQSLAAHDARQGVPGGYL